MLFLCGVFLLGMGLFADLTEILSVLGFPANKLHGPRGQADLVIVRTLVVVIASALIATQIALWILPQFVANIRRCINSLASMIAAFPPLVAVLLGAVVLGKTVLQLALYLVGYRYYAWDDFFRTLKADHWLRNISLTADWPNWLSLGSPWLPFPDYLFGLALAVHRDIYVTPKVVNMILSGLLVIVSYFLGRQLFGRTAGLLTATLCAFQPLVVWLGMSGMTSDILSAVMITLFGVTFVRWTHTGTLGSLLAASGSLFIASGVRYENWFFSMVFSLILACRLIALFRRGCLTRDAVYSSGTAVAIANAFPVLHMIASFYVLGDFIPALRETDSFKVPTDKPIPKISMALLALSAFPLELTLAIGGIVLIAKSHSAKSSLVYLIAVVTSLLFFVLTFKGRLPLYGAGPHRVLLPYVVLVLPYAGFLLRHLLRTGVRQQGVHLIIACLLLLTLGTLDLMRAFNFKNADRDSDFAAGWSVRMLQDIGGLSDDGRIVLDWVTDGGPLVVVALANRPERFVTLYDPNGRTPVLWELPMLPSIDKSCARGFETEVCRRSLLNENVRIIILWSPQRVELLKEKFTGQSWQIGKYHVFQVNATNQRSTNPKF
jgi:hypothetical protein